MLQLVFPETPRHELALESEGVTKGLRPKTINSRVFLSEPAAVTINESTLGNDLDLKRFFAEQKFQSSFHAVQLSCTFAPGEGESFERAQIEVRLSIKGGSSEQQPYVYSMSPLKIAQKIEVKQSS